MPSTMPGTITGLMQRQPLLISSILRHAARHHGAAELVSKTEAGDIHRTDYAGLERRARRLVRVLQSLGVQPGDRVATLAWNGHRHMELYYAASGMGAICHTVNPRLSPEDIGFILSHAADRVVFAEAGFAPLLARLAPGFAGHAGAIVLMTDAAHMPAPLPALPPGMALHCYETLMEAADEEYEWPRLDEDAAAMLCYTSGTTGRPKGVLYSHRSTVLHAMAVNLADTIGLRATDRALPVVPMFHVNAWGLPFAAPMVGAALVMPGRHLDGPGLHALMNEERVSFSAGVPTVWLGLLQHLRRSGGRLDTVQRLCVGGSACPRMLMEAFDREYGIRIHHGWGMTETSPIGTYNSDTQATARLHGEDAMRMRMKQGRAPFGIDMRVLDDAGRDVPWDGVHFGNLVVRGHWVCSRYFGEDAEGGPGDDGWFATGDVSTIDPDGFMEITDRTKDVIKSGGEWISSIQLEDIAMSHPDVAEAAIVAARHPKWDERPLLIVVPREGRELDRDALLAHFEGRVAKWWVPDDVVVVDALPHTATGKLHKLPLRARFAEHFLSNPAGVP